MSSPTCLGLSTLLFLLASTHALRTMPVDCDTALAVAAREGDLEGVRSLLDAGADPDCGLEEWPPIMLAAFNGNVEILEALLDAGAATGTLDGDYLSAISAAAVAPFLDEVISIAMIDRLVEAGASVRMGNGARMTPLMFAAREGKLRVAAHLLDHGARADYRDVRGWSPLLFAVRSNNPDLVRLLLDNGADPNVATDYPIRFPLHEAVRVANPVIVRLLLDAGADPSARNGGYEFFDPLQDAVYSGRDTIARILLSAGADANRLDMGYDPNSDDEFAPRTVLDWARLRGDAEIAALIEDVGGITGREYAEGIEAMAEAWYAGDRDRFSALIEEYPIDPTVPVFYFDPEGEESLEVDLVGSPVDDITMLERLLDAGAPGFWQINGLFTTVTKVRDDDHPVVAWLRLRFPLVVLDEMMHSGASNREIESLVQESPDLFDPDAEHLQPFEPAVVVAAGFGRADLIEVFLTAGADPDVRGEYGERPVHVAVRQGSSDVLRLLLERGADVDMPDDFGTTALFLAAEENNTTGIRLLLDSGADPDRTTYDGWNPLHAALRSGSREAAAILIERGAATDRPTGTGATPEELAREGGVLDLLD